MQQYIAHQSPVPIATGIIIIVPVSPSHKYNGKPANKTEPQTSIINTIAFNHPINYPLIIGTSPIYIESSIYIIISQIVYATYFAVKITF